MALDGQKTLTTPPKKQFKTRAADAKSAARASFRGCFITDVKSKTRFRDTKITKISIPGNLQVC